MGYAHPVAFGQDIKNMYDKNIGRFTYLLIFIGVTKITGSCVEM